MTSISVVIPCFNRAQLIRQVVNSIFNQTRPPDEVIVVDDCSTDESLLVIKSLPVKSVVHEHNQGVAAARNSGWKVSTSEIILFIDSDGIAEPRLIETLLSEYELSNDQIAGVGGRAVECQIFSVYDRWRALHAKQDYGIQVKKDVPFLFGVCGSYRSEVLEKVGGFDSFYTESVGEDADIGIRLHKKGYLLSYHPAAVVLHQHRDTRESLKISQFRWTFWNYFIKKRLHLPIWRLYAGVIKRSVLEPINDIFFRGDLELAFVDLLISAIKIKALWVSLNSDKQK